MQPSDADGLLILCLSGLGDISASSGRKQRYTLPRRQILKSREDVSRVFKSGKRFTGNAADARFVFVLPQRPPLVLTLAKSPAMKIKPDPGSEKSVVPITVYCGFAASKRNGNAVYRNRCKRLMREAYRQHQHMVSDLCFNFFDDIGISALAKFNYQAPAAQVELHLVFSARRGVPEYEQVEADILRHLHRIRALARTI